MNQNTKKVLVTGGCGYIGSHVARAFKNEGHTVHINDRVKRDHTLESCDVWWQDDFSAYLKQKRIIVSINRILELIKGS